MIMSRMCLLLSVVAVLGGPIGAAAQQWDRYGGIRDLPVAGGATGFFRIAKVGNRWVFVTPDGHAFWMRAVYAVSTYSGGDTYDAAVAQKYGGGRQGVPWTTFVQQAVRRLRSWGFNTIGEYAANYAYPVATVAGPGNPEKMPFIRDLSGTAGYSNRDPFFVKNMQHGLDWEVTPGMWRYLGFPDVFDPAFVRAADFYVRSDHEFLDAAELKSPWIVGVTMDDGDYLHGFGGAGNSPVAGHAHLGWMAMATSPTQTRNEIVGVTYTDQKVYIKYAARDFLKAKYSTIAALNAAWGSNYTSWDSTGAWPTGKGVLDESGRSPWLGKDFFDLSDTAPRVKADLDELVALIADKYYSTLRAAIKRMHPNHLVFSQAAVHSLAHPEVIKAAGRHCDVLQVVINDIDAGNAERTIPAAIERVYRLAHKPMFFWWILKAQADSPLADKAGTGGPNFPTQEARGQAYARQLRLFFTTQVDGTYPVAGIDYWSWTDKVVGGEADNWGLVSYTKDNAYDGKEAVIARGRDPWGYPTGGERKNFGNFLTSVKAAHMDVELTLRTAFAAARLPAATPAPSARAQSPTRAKAAGRKP